jgi:hypothetical protein
MQKSPATFHWHAANDNHAIEEPPSIIPARSIICANNDGDIAVLASASGFYGDTCMVNTGQLDDVFDNFNVDHQAARCLIDLVPDDFKSTSGWAALVPLATVPLFKQTAVIDAINGGHRVAITALIQHRASIGALIGSFGFTLSRACQHVSTSVLDFSTKLYVRAPLPVIGIPANDLH